MKIKTLHDTLTYSARFDEEVNAAIAEGFHLVKRDVLPGTPRMLYAELVKLDEPEPEDITEPEPIDPLDALRCIRDTCEGASSEDCDRGSCPMYAWCNDLYNRVGTAPRRWQVHGKEADDHGIPE